MSLEKAPIRHSGHCREAVATVRSGRCSCLSLALSLSTKRLLLSLFITEHIFFVLTWTKQFNYDFNYLF